MSDTTNNIKEPESNTSPAPADLPESTPEKSLSSAAGLTAAHSGPYNPDNGGQ